jgi:hypothetical protein
MSEETKVEPTPEQIEARVKEIRKAVAAFNADARHERYIPSQGNRDAIQKYMEERDLDYTEASLHDAFTDLSSEGKLTLYEESKLPPSITPKDKTSEELPPIGRATGADLGVGLADMQRARKQVEGVAGSNNRAAFMKASEEAGSRKTHGGRFHL